MMEREAKDVLQMPLGKTATIRKRNVSRLAREGVESLAPAGFERACAALLLRQSQLDYSQSPYNPERHIRSFLKDPAI